MGSHTPPCQRRMVITTLFSRGVVKQRILSYHMTPVTQAIRTSLFQVQC